MNVMDIHPEEFSMPIDSISVVRKEKGALLKEHFLDSFGIE